MLKPGQSRPEGHLWWILVPNQILDSFDQHFVLFQLEPYCSNAKPTRHPCFDTNLGWKPCLDALTIVWTLFYLFGHFLVKLGMELGPVMRSFSSQLLLQRTTAGGNCTGNAWPMVGPQGCERRSQAMVRTRVARGEQTQSHWARARIQSWPSSTIAQFEIWWFSLLSCGKICIVIF